VELHNVYTNSYYKDELSRLCRDMGEMRDVYRILVENLKGRDNKA
jgi:hypothetical protein